MSLPALGDFETAVLLAVVRLHDEAYGVRIRQDVSARTGRDCTLGALYTALQRLEDGALVTSWSCDPTRARGGRPKRRYRVTGLGDEALRRCRASAIGVRNDSAALRPPRRALPRTARPHHG